MAKLTKKEILEAMSQGAVLSRHYGVYGYWDLTYPDGTRQFNLRKGSADGISERLMKNIVLVSRGKEGYSYRMESTNPTPTL
jgi:hypothetical protein